MKQVLCPGQDTRYWRSGDIFEVSCGECGNSVEFFKDDAARRCKACGKRIENPKLRLGCAQWCEHAMECLGFDPGYIEGKDALDTPLTDRLIEEVKREFGDDFKRIEHALSVFENAGEILKAEGGDPKVVASAALLHDIGIKEAERKHGSSAAKYQEMEGPKIAERIMGEVGLDSETIDHVSKIVGSHHSARDIDTLEFRIIWDADWIVNIPEEYDVEEKDKLKGVIEKLFKTKTGRGIAKGLYLSRELWD